MITYIATDAPGHYGNQQNLPVYASGPSIKNVYGVYKRGGGAAGNVAIYRLEGETMFEAGDMIPRGMLTVREEPR